MEDHPVATPFVGTAPLTVPGNQVLLGGVDSNLQQGGRFTMGTWLGDSQNVGVEGNYFFLGRRSDGQSVAAPSTAPFVVFPGFAGGLTGLPEILTQLRIALAPGAAGGLNLTVPGQLEAGARVRFVSFLDGAEINGLLPVGQGRGPWQMFAGFRYLNLDEDMFFAVDLTGIGPLAGRSATVQLDLNTRNQFYGGQIGIRGEQSWNNWFVNTTAKLALGSMSQEVNGTVSGLVVVNGSNIALPAMGQRERRDRFAVIPEVTVNLGYKITENIQVFAGYNFLYASEVVRPGNQLVSFTSDDFWVQGAQWGAEIRW
jgi:hypothetical protein